MKDNNLNNIKHYQEIALCPRCLNTIESETTVIETSLEKIGWKIASCKICGWKSGGDPI
jgi:transcription elongation factor Elf1